VRHLTFRSFVKRVEKLVASALIPAVGDVVAVLNGILLGVTDGIKESGILASVHHVVVVWVNQSHDLWEDFIAFLN